MSNLLFSEKGYRIKSGEIFIKLGSNPTYEESIKNPDRHLHNLIVDIASEQIAEWAFTGVITLVGQHVPGILVLAVGTGDPSWDLQNPPAETASQTLLENELIRKTFSGKTYVDGLGNPTITRTNVIDYTTTYLESEAVGPLVEMGLFSGNGALATDGGTMINAKNFAVINKPSTSKLLITWRLTF
jgi:hypothetical protein